MNTSTSKGPPRWCYIAGAYTNGDPVENTHLMSIEWMQLQEMYPSVVFINPLIGSHAQQLITPKPVDFWYAWDLKLIQLLARSGRGCVYRFMPGRKSIGAEKEIDFARILDIDVLYGRDALDRYLSLTLSVQGIDSKPSGGVSASDIVPRARGRQATAETAPGLADSGQERRGCPHEWVEHAITGRFVCSGCGCSAPAECNPR